MLLIARFARYLLQKLLVAKIHLLLIAEVAKNTHYSSQNLLVTRCRSCSLQKFTCYSLQNSLVANIYSLLVAKFTCYLLQQITCYSMQNIIHHSLKQSQVHKVRWKISFFQYNLSRRAKNSKLFQVYIISWNLLLAEHFQIQQYTNGKNSGTTCSKS